jgi:hypothetical protein
MHADAAEIDARLARALRRKVRLRTLGHLDGPDAGTHKRTAMQKWRGKKAGH